VITVSVYGRPVTQGSSRAFVRGGRAVITAANGEKLWPWRDAVRAALVTELAKHPGWEPFTGPVSVALCFVLPKPASAPKRRRTWPIGARSGDLDKLTRSCLDAATDAGVWKDDAQVCSLRVGKDYPPWALDRPGVLMWIEPVAEGES
jgi:Holliday junction resolvase RusA-like endonuclease